MHPYSSRSCPIGEAMPASQPPVYAMACARRWLNAKGKQTKILCTPARAKQPQFSSVINSCCCSLPLVHDIHDFTLVANYYRQKYALATRAISRRFNSFRYFCYRFNNSSYEMSLHRRILQYYGGKFGNVVK